MFEQRNREPNRSEIDRRSIDAAFGEPVPTPDEEARPSDESLEAKTPDRQRTTSVSERYNGARTFIDKVVTVDRESGAETLTLTLEQQHGEKVEVLTCSLTTSADLPRLHGKMVRTDSFSGGLLEPPISFSFQSLDHYFNETRMKSLQGELVTAFITSGWEEAAFIVKKLAVTEKGLEIEVTPAKFPHGHG